MPGVDGRLRAVCPAMTEAPRPIPFPLPQWFFSDSTGVEQFVEEFAKKKPDSSLHSLWDYSRCASVNTYMQRINKSIEHES